MQVEGRRRDAVVLLEAPLGKAPKALNAVDGSRMRMNPAIVSCLQRAFLFRVVLTYGEDQNCSLMAS